MVLDVSAEDWQRFDCNTNYTINVDQIYNTPVENEQNYVYMANIEAQILDFTLNGSNKLIKNKLNYINN